MAEVAPRRSLHTSRSSPFPRRLGIGLVLIAVWWPVSWLGLRPLADYYFFPLWLGYILVVDGLVELRTGTSPIRRAGWRVAGVFLVSVPLWWVFELFNEVVGNWVYHTPVDYTRLEYALLASVAFSTVIPAVLTTTELVRSARVDLLRQLPAIRTTTARLVAVHLSGWLMVLVTVLWPDVFFPFVWLSLVFILDPLLTVVGGRSVASWLGERDWSPVVNLGLGTLICGWFWEMWNFYSLPKWTYDVPHVGFWHVWEMPVLGYSGYLPFGLEVYVFYELARQLPRLRDLPQPFVSARITDQRVN